MVSPGVGAHGVHFYGAVACRSWLADSPYRGRKSAKEPISQVVQPSPLRHTVLAARSKGDGGATGSMNVGEASSLRHVGGTRAEFERARRLSGLFPSWQVAFDKRLAEIWIGCVARTVNQLAQRPEIVTA